MNNITRSTNVRLLTLGLGLVMGLGAMSPAYSFSQADIDRLFATNRCLSCDLSSANLSGANLSVADLSFANLSSADLSNARLVIANLSSANLSSANLSSANLSSADLSSTNLRGANFTGANLSGAFLYRAIGFVPPTSTSLSAASVSPDSPNFTDAILEGVTAKNALLSNANFTGTSLKGSKFSSTDLQGSDFTSADLTDGIFNYVNFLGANLTNEQLASAKSLRGSTLPDGTVVAATPEPSSLFGFGAMIVLGVGSTLKRKIL